MHCVTSGSINAITSDANSSTYYGTTKVGTARIRAIDWHSFDTLNANQTNFHSKYLTRLYEVRTDNTITGTFDGASDLLNEGRLQRYKSSEVSGAYVGALITVNTTFKDTTTSDTVGISDYVVSGGVHSVTFDRNLSQKILYDSTYTISFDINDVNGMSIIHADNLKAAAANTTHTVKTAMADVAENSKIGEDPSGEKKEAEPKQKTAHPGKGSGAKFEKGKGGHDAEARGRAKSKHHPFLARFVSASIDATSLLF